MSRFAILFIRYVAAIAVACIVSFVVFDLLLFTLALWTGVCGFLILCLAVGFLRRIFRHFLFAARESAFWFCRFARFRFGVLHPDVASPKHCQRRGQLIPIGLAFAVSSGRLRSSLFFPTPAA